MRHSFALCELAFHSFEEDVLERVATVVHAANLDRALGGKRVQLPHFDLLGQDQFEASITEARAFTSHLASGFEKAMIVLEFEFNELEVGFAFLFQVAERGDASILKDNDLLAAFFDVAQKVRG